jgi:hypothetical protein
LSARQIGLCAQFLEAGDHFAPIGEIKFPLPFSACDGDVRPFLIAKNGSK